jgi:cation diffusion facilitator CzcD-associated flavoprotein CzcO
MSAPMPAHNLETDYLVVGSGAVAMAFVDTLVSETQASVLMVDRHHGPGGHWNDAYPFVRLHQPPLTAPA